MDRLEELRQIYTDGVEQGFKFAMAIFKKQMLVLDKITPELLEEYLKFEEPIEDVEIK